MKYRLRLSVWHGLLHIFHNGGIARNRPFIPSYFEFTTKMHSLNSNHIPKRVAIATIPIPNEIIFENADNIDDSLVKVGNAD